MTCLFSFCAVSEDPKRENSEGLFIDVWLQFPGRVSHLGGRLNFSLLSPCKYWLSTNSIGTVLFFSCPENSFSTYCLHTGFRESSLCLLDWTMRAAWNWYYLHGRSGAWVTKGAWSGILSWFCHTFPMREQKYRYSTINVTSPSSWETTTKCNQSIRI